MFAMSLIHQKIYQSDSLAEIDMDWYIKELIDYLSECFATEKKIKFFVDTKVIKLDIAQAIPLGLIINEALSNAIKYAFPNGRKGNVTVALKMIQENCCLLRISDNGIGLPEGFEPDSTRSLGMSLLTGLSTQMMGDFKMWNEERLILEVLFVRNKELPEQNN